MSVFTAALKTMTLGLLLSSAACRSDNAPAQEKPAAPAPGHAATPDASPAANSADTLHLPGGQVVQLRPTTVEVFNQLPASSLPDLPNDPSAELLATAKGQVRRRGLDLFLQSEQGGEVKLSSTPEAEFTLQNADGVKYMYWGSLPAAHQWVVRAWYWESSGTVLVDQRTGRRLDLIGDPVASPDGGFVLFTSPGLSGGDQANLLELAEITAAHHLGARGGPLGCPQPGSADASPHPGRWQHGRRCPCYLQRVAAAAISAPGYAQYLGCWRTADSCPAG
jgi:hypothetical protein